MTWQLSLAGLLIGVLVGATGMGGGSLMTPLLVFLFGFKPTIAIGTDIVHGALFKTFGAARHRRLGTVQARLSGWMLVGSAPMSLAGVAVATWIDRHYGNPKTGEGRVLGAALLLGALGLFAKSLVRVRTVPEAPFRMTTRDRVAAVMIGAVGGFIVGLTSVGSGVFFALWLLIVFPLRSAKVVGTDIFHAAALLWVAGAGHVYAGNVNAHAVVWLLFGSIPGVLVGSQLTLHIGDRYLRLVLAAVLALSGFRLLDLPAGDVVAAVGVVLALAALATLAVRSRGARIQLPHESREPVPPG
jgi:uncharacterized membrane protein YfcA